MAFSSCSPARSRRRLYEAVSLSDAPEKIVSKLPHLAAGYGDGTVRMFDLNKVEMLLKMHPHAASVTAISFSSDGKCSCTHIRPQ